MNERIQQLAEQCYETGPIGKDGWPEYSKFNESKFAELIVRECLNVINQPNGVGDDDVIRISDDVKRHFGVE
jgi:hypothetical protein